MPTLPDWCLQLQYVHHSHQMNIRQVLPWLRKLYWDEELSNSNHSEKICTALATASLQWEFCRFAGTLWAHNHRNTIAILYAPELTHLPHSHLCESNVNEMQKQCCHGGQCRSVVYNAGQCCTTYSCIVEVVHNVAPTTTIDGWVTQVPFWASRILRLCNV